MKETSTLLSLCRNRVRQLLAGGTLQFFGGEPRPGERWLIDCRSINELIDEKLPTSSDQSLVSINYLAKHSLPKGVGWSSWFRQYVQVNFALTAQLRMARLR